jgi:hypothetical protein
MRQQHAVEYAVRIIQTLNHQGPLGTAAAAARKHVTNPQDTAAMSTHPRMQSCHPPMPVISACAEAANTPSPAPATPSVWPLTHRRAERARATKRLNDRHAIVGEFLQQRQITYVVSECMSLGPRQPELLLLCLGLPRSMLL